VDPERQILEHLEPSLRESVPDEAAAMLALVAAERVGFDTAHLSAALRRALLVLAAGGDLHRELTLDDAAVGGLAADLDDPERRAAFGDALVSLRGRANDLPAAAAALDALHQHPDRAWLALAAALLADELTPDDED
jgi:hypothetical protein